MTFGNELEQIHNQEWEEKDSVQFGCLNKIYHLTIALHDRPTE